MHQQYLLCWGLSPGLHCIVGKHSTNWATPLVPVFQFNVDRDHSRPWQNTAERTWRKPEIYVSTAPSPATAYTLALVLSRYILWGGSLLWHDTTWTVLVYRDVHFPSLGICHCVRRGTTQYLSLCGGICQGLPMLNLLRREDDSTLYTCTQVYKRPADACFQLPGVCRSR